MRTESLRALRIISLAIVVLICEYKGDIKAILVAGVLGLMFGLYDICRAVEKLKEDK